MRRSKQANERRSKTAFEVWWNQQDIDHDINNTRVKRLMRDAWLAGYDKAADDRAQEEAGESL